MSHQIAFLARIILCLNIKGILTHEPVNYRNLESSQRKNNLNVRIEHESTFREATQLLSDRIITNQTFDKKTKTETDVNRAHWSEKGKGRLHGKMNLKRNFR